MAKEANGQVPDDQKENAAQASQANPFNPFDTEKLRKDSVTQMRKELGIDNLEERLAKLEEARSSEGTFEQLKEKLKEHGIHV